MVLYVLLLVIGNMEALTLDLLFHPACNHQSRTSTVEYTASPNCYSCDQTTFSSENTEITP